MLLDIYLCHAPADGEIAARITERLDRCGEARVWPEQCGRGVEQTMAAAWDGGSSASLILLLLSNESIPARLPREDWAPLLEHVGGNAFPPVGAILLNQCAYPALLERGRFLRCQSGPEQTLRELTRWAIALHAHDVPFVPCRIPWFTGREAELSALEQMLVDSPGLAVVYHPEAASGKTTLAQQFAARAAGDFRDVLWIACGGRTAESLAAEIGWRMGTAGVNVESALRNHRLLLVLDGLHGDLPVNLHATDRASVLVTTRRPGPSLPVHAQLLAIEGCAEAQPQARQPLPESEQRMMEALSVCRRDAADLQFAAAVAGIRPAEIRPVCERLAARRMLMPLDASYERVRLCSAAPSGDRLRCAHAEAAYAVLAKTGSSADRIRALLPEILAGFEWALPSDWRLAERLGFRAARFLSEEQRQTEAAALFTRVREEAFRRGDVETAAGCSVELSWIEDENGRVRPPSFSGDQIAFDFA